MRIIALINQKGGVGKTTTAASLGGALARRGRKVLLVDIDPQANLSLHLNATPSDSEMSIYDLLTSRCAFEDIVRETGVPNLRIAASNIDLCSADLELVNTVGRELLLQDGLTAYISDLKDRPDYVLIDCPPSLGLLSLNALTVAREVFVPIQAEFFALQGMGKLMEVVQLIRSRLNPLLKVTGIIVCMFRSQTNLAREVLDEVQGYFGDVVFKTMIRQNIRLAEAASHGTTIFEYDPQSIGALDYWELTEEIVAQERGETIAPHAVDGTRDRVEQVKSDPSSPGGEPESSIGQEGF